jgi:hypothetical protein
MGTRLAPRPIRVRVEGTHTWTHDLPDETRRGSRLRSRKKEKEKEEEEEEERV